MEERPEAAGAEGRGDAGGVEGGAGGGARGGGAGGLQDLLRGGTDGDQMMKMSSNMIRVFISSTFTDMSPERKVLQDRSYPQVFAFCRRLGLMLEVVDLRWGLRGVSSGDHEEEEVCLQEIRTCRRISAGPHFTVLLGNRYGHRALPRLIPEKLFEALLSNISKSPEGITRLTQWFVKDNNAAPPTYVLQPITALLPHYADLRPEAAARREEAALCWRLTEEQLLVTLREAAMAAEEAGDITAEQKQLFFTSVTERELDLGLWGQAADPSALVFLRDVPRQRVREGPRRLARFLEVTEGLVDREAQDLLGALKTRLVSSLGGNLNLHRVELSRGAVDSKRREHGQYLENLSQQFVDQMKSRVEAALEARDRGGRRRRVWGGVQEEQEEEEALQLVEEVEQQVAMVTRMSRGLVGREGVLGKLCLALWGGRGAAHAPLVVHGAAGIGKTALLCRLAREMQGVLEPGAAVVVRLLAARPPHRPDLHQVLSSICRQVSLACGLAPPTLGAVTHLELLQVFRTLLADVSRRGNSLLLVLDAVDQLSDRDHAHRLRWLPVVLPPNIHLVVSMETSSEAFASARLTMAAGSFLEVERLSVDEGRRVMESVLQGCGRTLTPDQSAAVLSSFQDSGSPLHLHLMLSTARRWTSYAPPTQLGANTQEVMSQLLLSLEEKHGRELVGGALGYMALCREGLLEAELRDVMSLDDDVISEVYRYALPPTPSLIRLPPLLWARLRWDLQDQLEERWAGGVATVALGNRHLYEAVSARYLTSERRGRSLRILADYFLGRWAGKLKPASLPGLKLLLSDRKAPPQPLWFTPGLANVRKLQELPSVLLMGGMWEELRQEVIGSADWLFCQATVCGLSRLIQDLDQCSRVMDCTETGLIRDALVLIRPGLDFLQGPMDRSLFFTELLSRLRSLATPFPSLIGRLCSQCDDWLLTCPHPVLIPSCSFLQQPGGALEHTLRPAQGAGVLCVDVSEGAGLLVSGADDGVVSVWSLREHQLILTLIGHTGAVLSVKLTCGPAPLLSLAADGSLRGWSLSDGQQLLCVQADSAPSTHLHLWDQLIFVYSSTQVKVWKQQQLHLLLLLSSGADEGSVILGVLQDSVVFVSGSGLIRISDPVQGTVEAQLETRHLVLVHSLILQKHKKVLVFTEDGVLYQVSVSGKHSSVEFPLVPSLLSTTEDEKILIAGSGRCLSLFSVGSDSAHRFLDLQHDDRVLSVCVSLDHRLLVSGSADHIIRIWSVTTGSLLDFLSGSSSPVTSVRLLSDGVVVSWSSAAPAVRLWRLSYDSRHKPAAAVPSGSAHLSITRDADQVFYVQEANQMEVISWSNHTGLVSGRLPVSAQVSCLELAQHKQLLFCGLTSGTVLIYPLSLPQETLCLPPPESLSRVLCVSVSSQEGHVAVAYQDSLCLFEITTRDSFPSVEGPLQTAPLALLQDPPSAMALLPDRRLLYGTGSGDVRLQDFCSGGNLDLDSHRTRVTCVTASNWGTHALVGSEDAVQRLWALDPLVLEHTMEYKGFLFEGVVSAAFSESDKFLFTGSKDMTVKVWDVTTGNLLCVQCVYSPVLRMVTYRNGFVALTEGGAIIRESFRCPDVVAPDYNPLRSLRAKYRVTSRARSRSGPRNCGVQLQDFNPAQFDLNVMSLTSAKPSASCTLV